MTTPFPLLLFLFIGTSLSGCVGLGPHDHWKGEKVVFEGVVHRLDFTLQGLDGEMRAAPEAPHCPTAWYEDGRINMFRADYERLRGEPAFVVVQAQRHIGPWSSRGSAGYPAALPLDITSVSINETLIAVSWTDGQVVVDGHGSPPLTWMNEDAEGGWRITATLVETTDRLEVMDPPKFACH